MKNVRVWIVASVFVACSMLLGLDSAAQVRAGTEGGVVVIGDLEALSGEAAIEGQLSYLALKTAVEDINAAGGRIIGGKRYTFSTKVYDHHYTTEGGATAANKLVFDDKVKYIHVYGSAPSLAAQAITEPNNVMVITDGWHKDLIGPKKPLSFRDYMTAREFGDALVRWVAKEHPEAKKAAILATNDATGYASAENSEATFKELGITVVRSDFFERAGSPDFYPYLARYIDAKVDVIELPGIASEHDGLICKQARELGFKGLLLGNGQMPQVIVDIAGKSAEGMFIRQGLPYGTKFATPAENKWNERCKKQSGLDKDMPFVPLTIYDAIWMLVKAMEMAGTVDRVTDVAKAMENLEFDLPLAGIKTRYQGEKTYGLKRQLTRSLFISQYRDGKWVVVGSTTPVVR